MAVNEINVKSIITKSNLPDADYVINPYGGCNHSCIYCYARFMKRFSGHDEKWGGYIDVKVNAADLIPKKSKKYIGKSIFIASVTDPYIALEKKYQLTREILKKLAGLKPTLNIQTKSDLVLRDIDILKQLEDTMVGLTLTTLDDAIRQEVEPGAAPVERRINALRVLKANGIKTYGFIGPILPYLTDWKEIILKTKDFVDFYMFENLNTAGSIWVDIKRWLEINHPNLLKHYVEIYKLKNGYWDSVANEIDTFCKKENVGYKIYFHHGKDKGR
ncbi:MAG TPA: radical SAM protein [Bacillota bacterium]|nr:radical SAM protein [Bacillota bacterium]